MDMKENNQKKMLLSVLGVAILVVAVVGISFAAFSTTFESTTANSVNTGTLMVSYSEPSQAINITDAMPLSDSNGIAQTAHFDFTVSAKADNALTVPYEISLTKVTTGSPSFESMADNQVKVYLEKGTTAVSETTATGKKVSELSAATWAASGAKLLHSDSFTLTGNEASATSQAYTLRMWISQDTDYANVTNKEYHAKVNVESRVTPIAS